MIFVPFAERQADRATPEDVLTGFLNADGEAHGRPVGVAVDKAGALLVADDVGNTIWRVTAGGRKAPRPSRDRRVLASAARSVRLRKAKGRDACAHSQHSLPHSA